MKDDQFKLIEDYDTLESLLDSEHDLEAGDLIGERDVARFLSEEELPVIMPRPEAFRSGVMGQIRKQRRRRLVWSSGLSSLAACLVVALLVLVSPPETPSQATRVIQPPRITEPAQQTEPSRTLSVTIPTTEGPSNDFMNELVATQAACILNSALLSPHENWSAGLLTNLSKQPGRTIVQLYTERFSANKIAQVFQCATASFEVTLSYTLRNLRDYLAGHGTHEGTP